MICRLVILLILLAGVAIATAQPLPPGTHAATILRQVKSKAIAPSPALVPATPATLTLGWNYKDRAWYEVYASPDLTATNWPCIAQIPLAPGEFVITNTTAPVMFYRVMMVHQPPLDTTQFTNQLSTPNQ